MPLQLGSLSGVLLRLGMHPLKRAKARAPFVSLPFPAASFRLMPGHPKHGPTAILPVPCTDPLPPDCF